MKSGSFVWNQLYQSYDEAYVEQYYRYKDADGRRFMSDNLSAAGLSGGGPGIEFSRFAPMQRQQQVALLALLPPEVARRIGYENALRLYRIKE